MKTYQVRFIITVMTTLIVASVLCGCTIFKDIEASENRDRLANLSIGMPYDEVVQHMGKPWKTEGFLKNEKSYTVLYYLTQRIPDGATTDDEMTPIVLQEGKLIGWGRRFFSDFRVEVKYVEGD